MCECGCGEFQRGWSFEGPEGIIYVIEFYRGCKDCGTSVGVVIHKFKKGDEWASQIIEDSCKPANFNQHGEFVLPIFSPDILKTETGELLGEFLEETGEIFTKEDAHDTMSIIFQEGLVERVLDKTAEEWKGSVGETDEHENDGEETS